MGDGVPGEIGRGMKTQLLHNARLMKLDGFDRHTEDGSDLFD